MQITDQLLRELKNINGKGSSITSNLMSKIRKANTISIGNMWSNCVDFVFNIKGWLMSI